VVASRAAGEVLSAVAVRAGRMGIAHTGMDRARGTAGTVEKARTPGTMEKGDTADTVDTVRQAAST
jgi:hypothetical protein